MAANQIRIAIIQAEPEWNDLEAGVQKSIRLIQETGANGANVLGFPEVFIPGYPWSIWANAVFEGSEFMDEYYKNSLVKGSSEMNRIRDAGTFVVLGYSERHNGSLYISQSFIDPTGTIVHHRRKIKPTHVERAYYGDGQADSLITTVPTPFGKVSGLNCWEHTQALLRYYTYSQDTDIHVASWPLIWDQPEGKPWPYHITPEASNKFSQVMAMKGGCFVMTATQILTAKNVEGYFYAKVPGGGFSIIFGPDGQELVKILSPGEEVILYADVDLHSRALAKHNLDIVGHYSRPDLLSLNVTKQVGTQVHFDS